VNQLAELARAMFAAAVDAVRPPALMRRVAFLADGVAAADSTLVPRRRLVLVALGKAAPGLAAAFLARCRRRPDCLFALAPHGVPAPPEVEPFLHRGAHPLPDEAGERATGELLHLLAGLDPDDGVVLLLSGGSSALLATPLPGITRQEVVGVTRALLRAGAGIHELNTVRKHLLAAAGGRLAAGCPAPILTLILSDVPGDDLATIASGPTVADPTTYADALNVLQRRGVAPAFPRVAEFLQQGVAGAMAESPKPGDSALDRSSVHLLGSNREALEAAADTATGAGFTTVVLTRTYRGEARALGGMLGALACHLDASAPRAVLAAGETTVTVQGSGRGGRNLEAALAAAGSLHGVPGRCVLVAGSDGVDGSSPAAGAVVDGDTLRRAAARGRDAAAALADNDSWGFFQDSEEAILTGPTGTNVADLAFILAAGGRRTFIPAVQRSAKLERSDAVVRYPRQTRKPT